MVMFRISGTDDVHYGPSSPPRSDSVVVIDGVVTDMMYHHSS